MWGKLFMTLILLLAIAAAIPALAVAFNRPTAPPPLASISDPFSAVDFRDLPPAQTFAARDGRQLAYHAYPADPGSDTTAVLIHGSSAFGATMHALARALATQGATAYALDVRGHGESGERGDIDYIGQLDDDLADFLAGLGPRAPNERRVLIGFSSGAGFAMRFAADDREGAFDEYVFVSPPLIGSSAVRSGGGAWAGVALPRIIALSVLNGFGVHAFDHLPTLAFAVQDNAPAGQARTYSHRLATNFGARRDFAADLERMTAPAVVLVGAEDELLVPAQLTRLVSEAQPDVATQVLPSTGHVDMIIAPAALDAIVAATLHP